MSKISTIKEFYESLKKQDLVLINEKANVFLEYLDQYSTDLKANSLLNVVLKKEWREDEQLSRDKVSVSLARNYIKYILFELSKHPQYSQAYRQSIIAAVADLFSPLKRLDSGLGEEFSLGSTNNQATSRAFLYAQILFYEDKIADGLKRYQIDHIVIPFLRTILESKIKQVLGVDIFRDAKNRSIEISRLLDILPELKSVQLDKAFNTPMLKLIMEWLNHYMHRNLRPEPFVIHAVFEYLKPMFKPGKRSEGDRTIHSTNISAFVKDIEIYHQEVERKLNQKYPDCFIVWGSKEVATFKHRTT